MAQKMGMGRLGYYFVLCVGTTRKGRPSAPALSV